MAAAAAPIEPRFDQDVYYHGLVRMRCGNMPTRPPPSRPRIFLVRGGFNCLRVINDELDDIELELTISLEFLCQPHVYLFNTRTKTSMSFLYCDAEELFCAQINSLRELRVLYDGEEERLHSFLYNRRSVVSYPYGVVVSKPFCASPNHIPLLVPEDDGDPEVYAIEYDPKLDQSSVTLGLFPSFDFTSTFTQSTPKGHTRTLLVLERGRATLVGGSNIITSNIRIEGRTIGLRVQPREGEVRIYAIHDHIQKQTARMAIYNHDPFLDEALELHRRYKDICTEGGCKEMAINSPKVYSANCMLGRALSVCGAHQNVNPVQFIIENTIFVMLTYLRNIAAAELAKKERIVHEGTCYFCCRPANAKLREFVPNQREPCRKGSCMCCSEGGDAIPHDLLDAIIELSHPNWATKVIVHRTNEKILPTWAGHAPFSPFQVTCFDNLYELHVWAHGSLSTALAIYYQDALTIEILRAIASMICMRRARGDGTLRNAYPQMISVAFRYLLILYTSTRFIPALAAHIEASCANVDSLFVAIETMPPDRLAGIRRAEVRSIRPVAIYTSPRDPNNGSRFGTILTRGRESWARTILTDFARLNPYGIDNAMRAYGVVYPRVLGNSSSISVDDRLPHSWIAQEHNACFAIAAIHALRAMPAIQRDVNIIQNGIDVPKTKEPNIQALRFALCSLVNADIRRDARISTYLTSSLLKFWVASREREGTGNQTVEDLKGGMEGDAFEMFGAILGKIYDGTEIAKPTTWVGRTTDVFQCGGIMQNRTASDHITCTLAPGALTNIVSALNGAESEYYTFNRDYHNPPAHAEIVTESAFRLIEIAELPAVLVVRRMCMVKSGNAEVTFASKLDLENVLFVHGVTYCLRAVICHESVAVNEEYPYQKELLETREIYPYGKCDSYRISSDGHYVALVHSGTTWTMYDSTSGMINLTPGIMRSWGVTCPVRLQKNSEEVKLNAMVLEWCSITGSVMLYSREDPI